MGKNIECYFSVYFNPKVGNSMGLSSQQLKGISKDFEKLNIKKLQEKGKWGILGWVLLRGKKGEVSYLDEDSLPPRYPRKDPKIIFEFPLSVTVDEIRFFTENAIRIFKDKFEQDSEMSFEGGFRRITKRPYKEYFSSILIQEFGQGLMLTKSRMALILRDLIIKRKGMNGYANNISPCKKMA